MIGDSTGHLIARISHAECIVLDRVAFDLTASLFVARGHDKPFSFEKCTGEELNGHTVAFVLFSALSLSSLELLSSICARSNAKDASIFTIIPASANADNLNITVNGVDYPDIPFLFDSKRFGSFHFKVEHIAYNLFSKLADIHILSRFHPLCPDDGELTGAFYELDALLWELNAVEHVYSLGHRTTHVASSYASEFQPSLARRKQLLSDPGAHSATVVFIDDLAICDPVACIMPYLKPSHLLDSVFAELSPDGHHVRVYWDSLSHLSSFSNDASDRYTPTEPFYTDLLQTSSIGELSWLTPLLMLKPQEALVALQNELLRLSNIVDHPLPEFSKVPQNGSQWADLFLQQVKMLLGPICNSGMFELLSIVQLIVACSSALSISDHRLRGESTVLRSDPGRKAGMNIEKLLARFERSLLVASQLDSKSLLQLGEATKCEPILAHAVLETKQIEYLDERFLVVVYLLSLLPVQLPISAALWTSIEELFTSGLRSRDSSEHRGVPLIPTCMTPHQLIANLQSLREKRRNLPSYNNLWSTQPRYRSPVVQMVKDLYAARANSKEASPSLKGLTHHAPSSGSGTWLTGWSRYIRIPLSESHDPMPYNSEYLILVLCGGVTFALARELLEIAVSSKNSTNKPLKLKIVGDRFIGGPSGLSGFFSLDGGGTT